MRFDQIQWVRRCTRLRQRRQNGVCSSYVGRPRAWLGVQPRLPVFIVRPLRPKGDMSLSTRCDTSGRGWRAETSSTMVELSTTQCATPPLFHLVHEIRCSASRLPFGWPWERPARRPTPLRLPGCRIEIAACRLVVLCSGSLPPASRLSFWINHAKNKGANKVRTPHSVGSLRK